VLRTDELDYDLPSTLVATTPAPRRDEARLMVVRRGAGAAPEHRIVADLPEILGAGDLLVFNTTRVVPARLLGRREDTGGGVEALFLEEGPGGSWVAMVKARRVAPGVPVRLDRPGGGASDVRLRLVERVADTPGAWVVEVRRGDRAIEAGERFEVLEELGHPPLPPYIRAARKAAGLAEEVPDDAAQYQTVYAREPGSVAAPTAGLHFTPALLETLGSRGVGRADVVLHVGAGTFKPVESEYVEAHEMHAEWCSMGPGAIEAIRRAREAGGRVIPVGTTGARTIETYAGLSDAPASVRTRLLITPGYEWAWTDGLLTNFHLPRSTLMAMVAALLEGGVDRLKALYGEAIERRYRFYSYGDAMLILP